MAKEKLKIRNFTKPFKNDFVIEGNKIKKEGVREQLTVTSAICSFWLNVYANPSTMETD